MEPRLRDAGTNMIKFHVSFETPARPGLLRLNSQFSFSTHPITTKRTFRVFGLGERREGIHSPAWAKRTHELKQTRAGCTIFRSPKAILMEAKNV
jgi:hypothetical protein